MCSGKSEHLCAFHQGKCQDLLLQITPICGANRSDMMSLEVEGNLASMDSYQEATLGDPSSLSLPMDNKTGHGVFFSY